MNFSPLQISQVTGGAKILGGYTGTTKPMYYWGFRSSISINTAHCNLCISDVTSSSVTGSRYLDWAQIQSGTSQEAAFYNGMLPHPVKAVKGIRAKLVGSHSACTCFVYYGG